MNVLVDSDLIIDSLKGIPSAVSLLTGLDRSGVAVSTITLAEVFEGAFNQDDPGGHLSEARRFLSGFTILDVTDAVAEVFARIRADLRRRGNLIPDMDLLIAATAIAFDLQLLTRNVRHFTRVSGLRLHHPVPEST